MNRALPTVRLTATAGVALALSACSTAKVVSDADLSPGPKPRPAVIYVADFDLGDDAVQSESLTAHLPLHALRERSRANGLVAAMGTDLAKDLAGKGLAVRHLERGEPLPPQGWLVRGTIVQLDEGSRVRRAVIGFGSGRTDVQVAVAIDNLADHRPLAPLYQMRTDAQSGKSPGAVVTLNPYVAAAKFVLSGRDLTKNAEKTASQIADRVASRVNGAQPGPAAS